jgi:signal peptidase I
MYRMSSSSVRSWLAGAGLVSILALATGCSTTGQTSAPRSSVSREHALTLANITAQTVGGEVFTIAPTGSMKPTLDESSVVAVEKVPFAQLRQGDIVIYRSGSGAPIIHRLYEQHGNRWLVLGDNNGSIDREAVTEANFVGRVCAIFYTSAGGGAPSATAFARR